MITLEKVRSGSFLVNDTLIIEALVEERHVDISTEMLDSYFSSLEHYISKVKDVPVCCLRSPSDAPRCPTLDEVEDAKRSLKECLSDLFKLNLKDRLAEALSTLSMAEVGLPASQASSVSAFWDRFGEFTSDFLSFEQDNAEFQLQMLLKDLMFSKMKMCHEQHITFKKLSKQLAEVEEEYERKMGEIRGMKKRHEQDIMFKNLSAKKEEEYYERKMGEIRKMNKRHEQDIMFKNLSKLLAKKEEEYYERKMGEIRKMNKRHEQDIMFKNLSKLLAKKEEEYYERKMGEIRKRKVKLESDWEVLMAESQEAKSKYAEHEKKAKDAEEKKRVAESTMAWSSLKQEFAIISVKYFQ